MKADLHCHSYFSDGKHSPEYLLRRAKELDITHIAITDHDFITPVNNSLAEDYHLQAITGVEISCNWENQEIHVVGLGIDSQNKNLKLLLELQREARTKRIFDIDKLLEKNGIKGLSTYFESLPCISKTRSHVADFLVSSRKSKSRAHAFKKYLGKKGRAFVSSEWISLSQANEAIIAAGGISVLAHPSKYPLNKRRFNELLEIFKQKGGDAIEVSYGGINAVIQKNLEEIAINKELYVSAGSDFHDAKAHWTDLGKFPTITSKVKKQAIWHHPRWPPQS